MSRKGEKEDEMNLKEVLSEPEVREGGKKRTCSPRAKKVNIFHSSNEKGGKKRCTLTAVRGGSGRMRLRVFAGDRRGREKKERGWGLQVERGRPKTSLSLLGKRGGGRGGNSYAGKRSWSLSS